MNRERPSGLRPWTWLGAYFVDAADVTAAGRPMEGVNEDAERQDIEPRLTIAETMIRMPTFIAEKFQGAVLASW